MFIIAPLVLLVIKILNLTTPREVLDYVIKTETYPSINTFLGFDLAYYFGGNLMNQGTLFSETSLQGYKGMSIDLNFFKTGIESGFENKNAFLLHFDDFVLKRIDSQ